MITTTVGMVNWVHGNTTSTGPADRTRSSEEPSWSRLKDRLVTLGLKFVVSPASLEQGLVDPSTTSDDTNGGTGATRDGLFCTGREADTGLVIFGRVSNDGGVGSGCPGEGTTITDFLLDAADDRSFGELAHGKNISNAEGSFLAAVDEGTSVKTLSGDESLFAELITVWITEDDTSERGAATFNGFQQFLFIK